MIAIKTLRVVLLLIMCAVNTGNAASCCARLISFFNGRTASGQTMETEPTPTALPTASHQTIAPEPTTTALPLGAAYGLSSDYREDDLLGYKGSRPLPSEKENSACKYAYNSKKKDEDEDDPEVLPTAKSLNDIMAAVQIDYQPREAALRRRIDRKDLLYFNSEVFDFYFNDVLTNASIFLYFFNTFGTNIYKHFFNTGRDNTLPEGVKRLLDIALTTLKYSLNDEYSKYIIEYIFENTKHGTNISMFIIDIFQKYVFADEIVRTTTYEFIKRTPSIDNKLTYLTLLIQAYEIPLDADIAYQSAIAREELKKIKIKTHIETRKRIEDHAHHYAHMMILKINEWAGL